jgi:hypothetical protein
MWAAVAGTRTAIEGQLPPVATLALLVCVGGAVYPLLLLALARVSLDRALSTFAAFRGRVTVG